MFSKTVLGVTHGQEEQSQEEEEGWWGRQSMRQSYSG
jgi:hypothetical protein